MLFQEENQSNSGAVDLVNLAQTVTASFLMHSWPLKMPRKHLSGTLASQTGRLCFDWLCSLMRPPNTCPLVHCVKYKVLKKPRCWESIWLPRYVCQLILHTAPTPKRLVLHQPSIMAVAQMGQPEKATYIYFWMSLTNVLWEGINNLTYYWIFCFYSAV